MGTLGDGGNRTSATFSDVPREAPTRDLILGDEVLEHYAWIFCQGGFPNLAITFDQFLMVVATLQPSRFHRRLDCNDCLEGS
jgi:hypothetical protein